MLLHKLITILALSCGFISTLFGGTDRGDRLVSEAGGAAGIPGVAGPAGAPGIPGIPGIPGAPGILSTSDFFALMPGDNAATVAADTAVQFPQNGPSTGDITRLNASMFLLPAIGTYLVQFQVSVTQPGQLMLRLNGLIIPESVVGRATITSQIVGMSLITTAIPNSILEVINPPGNTPALLITPIAGGTHSVSAHLVIIRIQ